MGIHILEKKFNLRILDCTAWLMPKALATRNQQFVNYDNVTSIRSLSELRKALVDDGSGFALDYVGPFSPKAILLFNELKARNIKIVVVDSGAYPSPEATFGEISMMQKILRALRYGGIRGHLNARIISLLLKLLPDQTPDYALVAGKSWQSNPRINAAREKIPAHSFDYEQALGVDPDQQFSHDKYIVYLDEDIAGHEDNAEMGFSNPASVNIFYPKLLMFFSGLEQISGLPVIISGYPSTDRAKRSGEFCNREIYFGKTASLVQGASLVLAHASTAISYAVIWRKPIVFLTSFEISNSWYQPWIEAPQHLLKASLVNIDVVDVEKSLLDRWTMYHEEAYRSYELTFIRSENSEEKSLWDILEDVTRLKLSDA